MQDSFRSHGHALVSTLQERHATQGTSSEGSRFQDAETQKGWDEERYVFAVHAASWNGAAEKRLAWLRQHGNYMSHLLWPLHGAPGSCRRSLRKLSGTLLLLVELPAPGQAGWALSNSASQSSYHPSLSFAAEDEDDDGKKAKKKPAAAPKPAATKPAATNGKPARPKGKKIVYEEAEVQ